MLKKKEILVHTGDVYQAMAFVHEGAVRFFTERGGEITTIYFSFKGELITSYNSFITGNPSSIGLEAIEKTFVLVLTQQSLAVLAVNPVMAFKIEQMRRRIAEYYILCYEDRTGSFLFQNPEERYLALLNSGGAIFQKIPQHYIADYLGVTAVSLSRIRNRSLGKSL